MKSRKFAVWLVWLILTVLIVLFCALVMIITHEITESMTGLIEKTLSWFFAISMMYLGVNAGQKVGYAIGDALGAKKEQKPEAQEAGPQEAME